jgi:hypothetical protein
MNGKTSKEKPKKTLTTGIESEEQLVIQERPVLGHATSMGSMIVEEKKQDNDNSTASGEPASAPILPTQTKRTVIVPISEDTTEEPTPNKDTAVTSAAPEVPKVQQKAASSQDETVPTKAAPAVSKSTAVLAKAADEDPKEAAVTEDEEVADNKDEKPNPETEKAIAEAAAAAKREKELETLIDSKEFNVPINAVARKQEVKHSALMTVAILLLGLILIDLMLDSGVIFLAEKIPHTHFFTTNSSN